MGVMLSVLCSYMGAIELVFIVRDLTHQFALHQMRLSGEEGKLSDISVLQNKIKASIDALETVNIESVEQMQDGVLYENGYRVENEQSVQVVAKQWDERRKVLCVSEGSTLESPPKSTVSNGIDIQNERTKNLNEDLSLNDDESNEQNNYRPIVRDDRTGRRKAFKKRHSSSSQSSESVRHSREEELKMFTSLEEEEYKNNSFNPINYSNNDSSFPDKQKYDAQAWGNKKPSNYHDSELWKRERATSIVEEKEDNSSITNITKHYSSNKRTGVIGTADKPTRKTSCENENYASDIDACEPLDNVDNNGLCTLNSNVEIVAEENVDANHLQSTEPNRMIKKIDNSPNLIQYFKDAGAITPMVVEEPCDDVFFADRDATKSRDVRSTTVYSRSDSENSSAFHKSISRDSSSTADLDYVLRTYNRTDSSNSFIQDELDSEEYHHKHRHSLTAETLEYIRGRDDWRAYIENKLNNVYQRQSSSNLSIQGEIDSDEYHHDRKLSDLIEIAYFDAESIKSLPSSFEEGKVFDRYYLELQQINGQLSTDIEQNIAQKQVILLDSSEIEATEGYVYPLPDIILDQVSDHGDIYDSIDLSDSDYSNVSESEDDMQSVVEVNHGTAYEGEIITTLDMGGDFDEMIEVTLWDLNDAAARELSSKESSIEIISMPNESYSLIGEQVCAEQSNEIVPPVDEITTTTTATTKATTFDHLPENETTENSNRITVNDRNENIKIGRLEDSSKNDDVKTANNLPENISVFKDEMTSRETNHSIKRPIRSEQPSQNKAEDKLLHTLQQNSDHRPATGIETSKLFIEHESLSSAREVGATQSHTTETSQNSGKSKKTKKVAVYEDVDDLIKEGCMGVWFHN